MGKTFDKRKTVALNVEINFLEHKVNFLRIFSFFFFFLLGRERQKAAESRRSGSGSGWDERTAAALAPRLAPRCSAPLRAVLFSLGNVL